MDACCRSRTRWRTGCLEGLRTAVVEARRRTLTMEGGAADPAWLHQTLSGTGTGATTRFDDDAAPRGSQAPRRDDQADLHRRGRGAAAPRSRVSEARRRARGAGEGRPLLRRIVR